MECTNPEIGRLLPGYMTGELSAEEIEAFREHLYGCPECSDLFIFTLHLEDRVKKYGNSLFSKSELERR